MVASSHAIDRAHLVHAQLVAVRKERRILDYRTAVLLAQIDDEGLYRVFGHTTIYQYAKAEHALGPRPTGDLLRIARKLPNLPAIAAAFADGQLDKSKVREIVTVATPDTEAAWVERAKVVSSRVVEALVGAVGVGEAPPEEARHRR